MKKALKQHKIAKLPGFGEKSEEDIMKSLGIQKEKRYPLKKILPIANQIVEELKKLKL